MMGSLRTLQSQSRKQMKLFEIVQKMRGFGLRLTKTTEYSSSEARCDFKFDHVSLQLYINEDRSDYVVKYELLGPISSHAYQPQFRIQTFKMKEVDSMLKEVEDIVGFWKSILRR